MDNSSEGSKLPSLLTSLIKTGNYRFLSLQSSDDSSTLIWVTSFP